MPPSPSLEYVTLARKLSTAFSSWLERACKVYGNFMRAEAIVDNALFRDKVKELTGEKRAEFVELLMDHDKVEKALEKFVTSKDLGTFRTWTDEELIKWLDETKISVGFCDFREGSRQYWLWDMEPKNLPYNVHLRKILEFYRVPSFLPVPTKERAEADLIDFVVNVKDWDRRDVEWVIKNFYPLEDGFWTSALKAIGVATKKDLWKEAFDRWKSEVEVALQGMPEYKDLGKAVTDVAAYVRTLIDDVADEVIGKYTWTTENLDKAKAEFLERAKQVLVERVPPESRVEEVYEQVKLLVPAEKVEKTREGLLKAIRYVFAYPDVDLERLASWWVFPLDFTTEQAREIASKVLEKVTKKPPPPPITPCDVCGNVELNWDRDWAVSKEEWQQVVPERWRDSTLCPWCFVKFAAEHRKEYEITYHNDIAIGVKKVEKPIPVPPEVLESLRADLREKGTEYSSITDEYTNLEAAFLKLEEKPNLKDAEELQSQFLKFLPRLEPLKRNYEALRARASELYGKAVEVEPPEERLRILRELDNIMKAQIDVYVKNLDFYKARVETYMLYRVNEMIKELVVPPPPPVPPFEERAEKLVKLAEEWAPSIVSWETIEEKYGLSFTDEERDRIKRYWIGRFPKGTEISIQWGITIPKPEIPRIHATRVEVGKYRAGEYYIFLLNPEKYGDRPIMAITLHNIKEIEEYLARGEEEYIPEALGLYPEPGEEWWEELPEELKHNAIIYWNPEDIVWSEEVEADRVIWHKVYTREDLEPLKVDELRRILSVKGLSTVGKKEELIDRILGVEVPPPVVPPHVVPPVAPPPPPPPLVPVPPPPVERGLQKADEKRLLVRFDALLLERTITPAKWRPMFEDALYEWREAYKNMPRDEALSTAMKDVEGLADRVMGLAKPPVKRPPEVVPPAAPPAAPEVYVPPAEILGPRTPRIRIRKCWVLDCPEIFEADEDLEQRVRMVPVMKADTPHLGPRYEPLLRFPPIFYYLCPMHREERFGYRDVIDALAYLYFETESSKVKRLTVTKESFRNIGLSVEDMTIIQARAARWRPE